MFYTQSSIIDLMSLSIGEHVRVQVWSRTGEFSSTSHLGPGVLDDMKGWKLAH